MKKSTSKSKYIELNIKISKDYRENLDLISELIEIALKRSTPIPELSVDDFIVQTGCIVKENMNMF